MTLPLFDRVLVVLLVLEVLVATNGAALADPPPECDDKCRERRFYKIQSQSLIDQSWSTRCQMWYYRECFGCSSNSGLCSPNSADTHTNGSCLAVICWPQWEAIPAPSPCTAMCSVPDGQVAYSREAAEGPTTYSDIGGDRWVERFFVRKCRVDGQPYLEWPDEVGLECDEDS
jgi:hypothetical protein